MSGWLPPGVTDRMIDEAQQGTEPMPVDDRDDAIDALQQAGMEPMSTAPKDREITIVLEANLVKVRAFWHDDIFSGGCWMNVDGDWGNDDPWLHWQDDELIGWLPAGGGVNHERMDDPRRRQSVLHDENGRQRRWHARP